MPQAPQAPQAAPPFAHLAARTCYSLRHGAIRPDDLAAGVAAHGMDAVGVTDRAGLYGLVRIAQACAGHGVRQIIGADLALAPDPYRPGWAATRRGRVRHGPGPDGRDGPLGPTVGPSWLEDDAARVAFIAADARGYANLVRLVSDHHLDSDRGTPQATRDQIAARARGMYALLGDDSPMGRLLASGRPDDAAAEVRWWMDVLGPDRVLIGVTHHHAPGDDERARTRFALADRLGLRAVADDAPRYLERRDAALVDVLDAIRKQVGVDPRHSDRRNAEGHLRSPEAVARTFAERPDAVANAGLVAESCHVDIGLGRLRVPDLAGSGADAHAELADRCRAGLARRYANPGRRHDDLLAAELDMVAQLGLAAYFLTVAEIVDRIRAKDILVACRGSAAGSIITYALGISDVDPIRHDLCFERFMNPYRDELPDIDLDVESARREDIYRDLLDTYGTERIACVAMVETFKARMAIREVGKALGMPAGEVDYIAKSFPRVRAGDVRKAMAHLPEMRGLNLDRPHLALLFDIVERLDGFPRHIALHPSGVLLGEVGLRDLVPVETSAAGFAMAQLDKDDVEALGLCKLDVLAVRMLSAMSHAVDEAARLRGVTIDFDTVGDNDDATFELVRSTRTLGMFQIESPGQRELIGKFQPDHTGDLVIDISLFRPGPVKGDMIGPFLQRRLGQKKAVYPHPILEPALRETFGVIVYHEQVMRCVAAVTGCDLATADLVRRRLGDPDEVEDLGAWIMDGARQRGLDADTAAALWHALVQFGSFGFCKAHAAAFAVPTYRSAWLKTHHLPELLAGLLTHDPGMYPRRLLLDDARQLGVAALGVDVNASARDHRVARLASADALGALGVPPPAAAVAAATERGEEPDADAVAAARAAGLPRGWRWTDDGTLLPPGGFDLGRDPDRPGERFAVRLALSDVAGIDDGMVTSILLGRPFDSVEDLRRRAKVSAPVAEHLAHAGAMDRIGGVTAGRSRRDLMLEVVERWSGISRHAPRDPAKPTQMALLEPAADAGLPDYTPAERVRAELEVLGMETTGHVMRFYDALCDHLGVTAAVDLLGCRDRQRVRIAGAKVATQTPPVKSGQRIVFLSIDDGTGVGDATFFESVHDRCAWTVFHSWLLIVEGTVHRTGRRGVSINAEAVWDLRRLARAWREGWLDRAVAEAYRTPIGGVRRPPDEAARDHSDTAPSGATTRPGRDGIGGLGSDRDADRPGPAVPEGAETIGERRRAGADGADHHHPVSDAANLAAAAARGDRPGPRAREMGAAAATRSTVEALGGSASGARSPGDGGNGARPAPWRRDGAAVPAGSGDADPDAPPPEPGDTGVPRRLWHASSGSAG